MADVSSSAGAARLHALLNQSHIAETPGAPGAAARSMVELPRLDTARDVVSLAELDGEEWGAEAQGSHGYLPNAGTITGLAAVPASDVGQIQAEIADTARPALAVNSDQRATSLRSHIVWQEDQFDDGDDGIYSPILKVTRRASANL